MASRHIDIRSIAGFGMSFVGATALVVELVVRGWWGFATSGWDLLFIMVWLGASGWMSWRAYEWTEGWWKVLAFFGVLLSVVAAVFAVAIFAFRVLVENPDLLKGNSKRRGGSSRGMRQRRR